MKLSRGQEISQLNKFLSFWDDETSEPTEEEEKKTPYTLHPFEVCYNY